MELQGDWVMCNLILVWLEMELALVQDRCAFCAKRTIGSENILDVLGGSPKWRGSSGSSFQSIRR
jgi:hypothetical protein